MAITQQPDAEVLAVKDESQRSIPTAWRAVLREIVSALVRFDYGLKSGVQEVEPVSADTALHIQDNIHSYGEELIELPNETWNSSVCMWMGDHWEALVDLWTREEGRSDLVLSMKITEVRRGYSFKVYMVYVP